MELTGVNLQVADWRLDSTAFKDKQRVFYAQAITLNAVRTNLRLPHGYYQLKTGRTTISTEAQEIKMKNVALVPRYQPPEMARRKGKAVTWLELKVPDVQMTDVNFSAFSHLSNIAIGTIQVRNPTLKAYMDRKNFAQKGEKPLPHDLIQNLKTGLTINKVEVKNMHIRYEELAPEATETGFITFEKLYATLTNITNDKNLISAKTPAVIDLRTAIMGKALLKATIQLNLPDLAGYHTITGSVGETDAGILNKILEPTSFVSIKSGFLQKSNFQIKLNRNTASGTMRASYKDFKIELLSKDKDKRQSLGKKLLSTLVNKTVVESNNSPDAKEGLRVGKIAVTRKKNRSVLSYWKDCFASGLLSSAGIENIAPKK